MDGRDNIAGDVSCFVMAGIMLVGLVILAVRLKDVQIRGAANYSYANDRQSVRRVQTAGARGLIVDCRGRTLAANRRSVSVACNVTRFQKKSWLSTVAAVSQAVERVSRIVGSKSSLTPRDIRRHVDQTLAMPLVVWRDIGERELARFCEHEDECEGFSVVETDERVYPQGTLASHLLGYVGRDRGESAAGDEKFNFYNPELRGRSGVEIYYDSYLRGVPGEVKLQVDARGFAVREWTVVKAQEGPVLRLSIDADIQRAVEAELAGEKGACVVLDAQTGDVLAMASAPGFNPNDFVPSLPHEVYQRYANDPLKPLLNRAAGGAYAPGSTFKPVTALAGLSVGQSPRRTYDCSGIFTFGNLRLRCARRWGHGPMDMRLALRESCNAYFCHLGANTGTNAIFRAAAAFGLGTKTGIDFGVDMAGAVPDGEWKKRQYGESWFPGDLVQMSIGQGLLLVSPLQMARVAGAIGTGFLVTPHVKKGLPAERRRLPFPEGDIRIVREGMRLVVDGGTGRRGGENVNAYIIGKTGTAEVGRGENRRKNTWFIAYARPSRAGDAAKRLPPETAVAMVIENGESGGGTTAPRVRNVLASVYGERPR